MTLNPGAEDLKTKMPFCGEDMVAAPSPNPDTGVVDDAFAVRVRSGVPDG